jgi:hypothetical protein
MMKMGTTLAVLAALALTPASAALAHNRAHIVLPIGTCIIVGSEKSVTLPDGTLLDLRPETTPADEIGTAFAAEQRGAAKGPLPVADDGGRAARRDGFAAPADDPAYGTAGP